MEPMPPISPRTRRAYFLLSATAFFIVSIFAVLYTQGYRLSVEEGLILQKTGGLYITAPTAEASVFINGEEEKLGGFFSNGLLVQKLVPGFYTVLVAKEGYWPWVKLLPVTEGRVTEARSFLVSKTPEKEPIPELLPVRDENGDNIKNTRYQNLIAAFSKQAAVSEGPLTQGARAGILSESNRIRLIQEEKNIYAYFDNKNEPLPSSFCKQALCSPEMLVFWSTFPIKHVSFLPGRDDVALIAVEKGVYAIDIDLRGEQNFVPVYTGIDPTFLIDNGVVIVKEGVLLFELTI